MSLVEELGSLLAADGQDGWLFFPGFIFKTYLSPPPLATVVCEKQRNDVRLYMFGALILFLSLFFLL